MNHLFYRDYSVLNLKKIRKKDKPRTYIGTLIIRILTTSLKILSGMFLEELHTACAEECENITGASLTSRVSLAVWIELWERSTIIPNRFISSTTVWKKKPIKYVSHYEMKYSWPPYGSTNTLWRKLCLANRGCNSALHKSCFSNSDWSG